MGDIPLPIEAALGIRRLLWDIGASESTQHDQKVECYRWATYLDQAAGMPAWPFEGGGTQQSIAYYEGVRDHIEAMLRRLREYGEANR